jgi:hypothetical protein
MKENWSLYAAVAMMLCVHDTKWKLEDYIERDYKLLR